MREKISNLIKGWIEFLIMAGISKDDIVWGILDGLIESYK